MNNETFTPLFHVVTPTTIAFIYKDKYGYYQSLTLDYDHSLKYFVELSPSISISSIDEFKEKLWQLINGHIELPQFPVNMINPAFNVGHKVVTTKEEYVVLFKAGCVTHEAYVKMRNKQS